MHGISHSAVQDQIQTQVVLTSREGSSCVTSDAIICLSIQETVEVVLKILPMRSEYVIGTDISGQ